MNPPAYPASGGTQDVFFLRTTVSDLPTIVRGDGVHLVDDQGRRLLDACSGPFTANLGQGNERVLAAMVAQGRLLSYTYSRTTRHEANAALSRQLAEMAGPGFERVHLTSGGSEAVEMALKILRAHALGIGQSQRHVVVSLMPGYHGATLQTLALNGDVDVPRQWGPLAVLSEKIPAPLTFRAPNPEQAATATCEALEEVLARVGAERVLALIVEPIGGQSSGVNVPHPSFLKRARSICRQYGIHFVFDEIVSAFRTGCFLAAHHDRESLPDAVVLAKGLGAGYVPLGAVLMSSRIVDELAATTGFAVSHSYDANPIACAAGSAVLEEVVARNLIDRGAKLGGRLRDRLDALALDFPMVGDVRGRGLLQAVELVADPDTNRRFPKDVDPAATIRRHGLDRGILLYSRRQNGGLYGDWLLLAPPLVIDEQICDELVDRFESAIRSAEPEIHRALAASDGR